MRGLLLSVVMLVASVLAGTAGAQAQFLQDIRDGQNVSIGIMGTSLSHPVSSTPIPGFVGWWVDDLKTYLQGEATDPGNVTFFTRAVGATDSGFGVNNGLGSQLPLMLGDNPDVVFIEFAVNDALTTSGISVAQSTANLNSMVSQLQANNPDIYIILQTMNITSVADEAANRPNQAAYQQATRDVAAAHDLLLIEHFDIWADLRTNDPTQYATFVDDGVHPTQAGTDALINPNIVATLNAVPEPGSLAFLGLGGLMLMRRRRT